MNLTETNMSQMNLSGTDANALEQARLDVSPVLLSLQDVSIAYEAGDVIVKDVTLSIHQGETVLFLGPSGCGKSTLAMLCAGLIPRAVEGTVTGQVWQHPRLLESGRIGYVFQDADAQFCMLTVADEIAFGLENLKLAPGQMRERILNGLKRAGLEVALNAPHAEFSGGLKQKLAVACALSMDADLLVFDEPTANLDPLSTRQVFDQISVLHQQRKSMIVIEHKFDALLPQMDRVVLFGPDGRIHRTGPVMEVIQEEWDWLVSVGVIPPWKSRPQWLPSITEAGRQASLDQRGESRGGSRTQQAGTTQPQAIEPALSITRGAFAYKSSFTSNVHQVWSELSVQVPKGSFTAIVGPNGAGKSSLLQVFAGMRKLTGGESVLLGRPHQEWKRHDLTKAVSYCFQNPEFQFIYERVADELANHIVAENVPPEIESLLAEFGLAGLEQQSPFALSQGQKRRLSVAAMVREEHELYLLDEPTFGQDAATQYAIMERLAQLHESGKTIVMTTHDMDLVREYANQVIVIADGGLLFEGKPEDLFSQPGVLRQAHLLDDIELAASSDASLKQSKNAYHGTSLYTSSEESHKRRSRAASIQSTTDKGVPREGPSKSPAQRLNPPWLMISSILAMLVAIFANNLPQALAMFALPVSLLFILRRLTPWQVIKRLSPFLLFYVLYVWSLTAYGAIPPGTPAIRFLWMHLSWVGFHAGLVLAFRMLGAVAFGVLFVSSAEITDLIVGLSKNFRIPPKFSYGILAGIRFAPLFQSEWSKLKQARQLRGKDARYPILRPVMYTLPLLSQAIRMSERVATAMEARGFYGDVAAKPEARTYYREVAVHAYDFIYLVVVVGLTVALLLLFR